MFSDSDDQWEYIPVETADEVNSHGDVIECNQLKNWNRWLKIRKEQHKNLGLMICRSTESLLINKSDKFRSKVECKCMIDLAFKIKINNGYKSDYPYSIDNEIRNFTSVYTPDVIQKEKSVFSVKPDCCSVYGKQMLNKLYRECPTLKSLIPINNSDSAEKLAIVGEKIVNNPNYVYRGTIPSIYVSERNNEEHNDYTLVAVKINDFIVKSISNTSKFETLRLYTKSKPINIVNVNEDFWDEIIIENCGQISVQYKWIKDERITTIYDCIIKEQPMGCFFFDTRTNILGPGQVKRLKLLFRPNKIGPHSEIWFVQVEIMGRLDPITKIRILLQGCALPNVSTSTKQIPEIILFETIKAMCSKVARAFVQNLFGGAGRSAVGDKYHYHGYKMDRLYHAMHVTESGPVPLDDLVRRCTQLDRSLANKYSDLVGRTAVTLLKSEMVCGHGVQLTGRGLNARKTMYVALDFIDLTLNAYEPDYDEACREIQQLKSLSVTKKKENDGSVNTTADRSSDCAVIREDWLAMMKPMVYKFLEWAVDRILDYDDRWTECRHGRTIDKTAANNERVQNKRPVFKEQY